jgi:FdhD protein
MVEVLVAPGVAVDLAGLTRHVFATSSCGVCGSATLEAVRRRFPRVTSTATVTGAALQAMAVTLRAGQALFDETGGVHGVGLFGPDGACRVVREDVGRHNAVDKVVGWAFTRGMLPLDASVLVVSGRASFEIVQKAAAAGVPVVAAVSAPSSLAVDLAEEAGVTLVGFLRPGRFNVYARGERVVR